MKKIFVVHMRYHRIPQAFTTMEAAGKLFLTKIAPACLNKEYVEHDKRFFKQLLEMKPEDIAFGYQPFHSFDMFVVELHE